MSHDKETPRGAARRRRSGTALGSPHDTGRRPATTRVRIPTAPPTRWEPAGEWPHHLEKGTQGVQPSPTEKPGGLLSAMCAERRLRCGAAGPDPTTSRPEWPGLSLTGARGGRAPHRACAAPRAPGESPGRGRGRALSGPSRLSVPIRPVSTSTACPSDPRLGGRPPLPGTHRYPRGGLPAAPSPQSRRRRRLRLSPPARRRTKAPPTDRRGHEAMAVRAESGGRGRARSGRRGNVARARRFTAGLSWGCRSPYQ